MATIDGMNRKETARAIAFLSKEIRETTATITRAFKNGLEVDSADVRLIEGHVEQIKSWTEFWNEERRAELTRTGYNVRDKGTNV